MEIDELTLKLNRVHGMWIASAPNTIVIGGGDTIEEALRSFATNWALRELIEIVEAL